MDPITIALGLAQFVPTIVKWIAGDKAGDVAKQVVGVAQAVTGKSSGDEALAAIKSDPNLAMQFQQAMMAHELSMYQAETARLETVNQTIRAEVTSDDKYTRRMRPTWGYCMCLAFTAQMLAVTYVILVKPQDAAPLLNALAALSTIWGIGLAVLGIQVAGRTSEKHALLTGQPKLGVFGALAQRIAGK